MRRSSLSLVTLVLACSPHVPPPEAKREAPVVVPATPPERQREPLPPKPTTTWTTLTVAPGCELQIADTPEALGPPLTWTPCKGGPEGCLETATQTEDALAPNVDLVGVSRGGKVTIAVMTMFPGPKSRYVLAPRDGLPFFALEGLHEEQCSLGQVGMSDDGAAIEVAFDHKDGYASRAYLRGPLAADPSWREVAAVLPRREFPQFIGASVLSVGGRVMVEQSGGPLRWYDAADKQWVEVPGSHDGWECEASGHGDAVVFSYSSIPERPMAAKLGEPAHPLRRGPVEGTSPVMIDGDQAVWLEGSGRDRNNYYKKIDLWRADVVAGPALADARHVMPVPRTTMTTPTFGGGLVVVPLAERDNGMMVVRLATAEKLSLQPPIGLAIERVLWLTPDEVAVRIGPAEMTGEPSLLRRIPVAALPPYTEK